MRCRITPTGSVSSLDNTTHAPRKHRLTWRAQPRGLFFLLLEFVSLLGPRASHAVPSYERQHILCSVALAGAVAPSAEQHDDVERTYMQAGVRMRSARARFPSIRSDTQRSKCRRTGSSRGAFSRWPTSQPHGSKDAGCIYFFPNS